MMQFPESTITQEFLSGFLKTWQLWAPLLLLLVGTAWATRRYWGGKLLLLSLAMLAVFATKLTLNERASQRRTFEAWNRLRVPLSQAAKIDGLQLAAGTMVRWDEQHGHLLTADLRNGQAVAPNVVLGGEVSRKYDEWWTGTLVQDSEMQGWHCAAGKIDWYRSGSLRWCLLSRTRMLPAGEIPAGTAVLLRNLSDPSDVLLHLPNVGMIANPGNVWLAPDRWFALTPTGELKGR